MGAADRPDRYIGMEPMQPLHCFSDNYEEARSRFLTLCGYSHAFRASYLLPRLRGRNGELLATDVGWFGPADARAVIMVTSGTHGVEGFAGSACQMALARVLRVAKRQDDIAFVLVHAVNPYGFSHLTRVNEENIDLNRNFQDFDAPLGSAGGYAALHEALVADSWDGPVREQADARLAEAWATLGERGFQQVVCAGQHDYPDGLFYGGTAPTWSNYTLRSIIADLRQTVELLVHIDIHTGLGAYGYGELVYTLDSSTAAAQIAESWFGDMGIQMLGGDGSATTRVHGTLNHAFLDARPATLSVSIEYGTVDFEEMFRALREEHLLRMLGRSGSPEGINASQALRACFESRDDGWRHAVITRFDEVVRRSISCARDWLEGGKRQIWG